MPSGKKRVEPADLDGGRLRRKTDLIKPTMFCVAMYASHGAQHTPRDSNSRYAFSCWQMSLLGTRVKQLSTSRLTVHQT